MRHTPLLAALALLLPVGAGAQGGTSMLQARLFSDINYIESSRDQAEGFRAGQLVGHLAAGLTDRLKLFGEVSASAQASGYAIETERLILRYDQRDWLKLSAGRYHTPVSYWNTAFHHGQWLQTSVARPNFVRGGGPLPLHFVGVQVEGSVAPGPVSLGYVAAVGNGRGTNVGRAGDAGDANGSRATVVGATLRLAALPAARLGGAYYADRVTPTPAIDQHERIATAHVAWEGESPEVIAEYARVRHWGRDGGQPATVSRLYYGQVAYRLPGRAQAFKPYVRAERTHVPDADVIYAPLKLDYAGLVGGLRIDLAPVSALKLEYRHERVQAERRSHTIAAQVSFTFPGVSEDTPAPTVAAAPRGGHDHEPR